MTHRRLAFAAVMLVAAAAAAQQPAPAKPAPAKAPGGTAVVQTYKGKAVILFVDYDARNITCMINGQLHNYTISDSVQGIMNIKKGDTVTVEVVEALGVFLKGEKQPAVGTAAQDMTVQPQGKPAMSRVKVSEIAGTVAAVNYDTRVMSIAGTKDTLTFVADTSLHDLHAFKVGDHVTMRYTAAMMVSIVK
ncbi:MAG TPA: hypothetical protein VMT93_05685 [Gemmatimonadaceae bacterium]|nr:hypothetical protein [Gemmatimonadaceae bacterium]